MMKDMVKERESNIELLRIVCILGVILLHYNSSDVGGGFTSTDKDSIQYISLMTIESICAVAVNVFILITGYFSITTQKRGIVKPIELILQVIIFQVTRYFLKIIIDNGVGFSLKKLVVSLLPVNYFVILYCVLYIMSPLLNKVLNVLDRDKYFKTLLVGFLLFSVEPILVDILISLSGNSLMGLSTIGINGSQAGYTIVNFVLMYAIGGYLRLHSNEIGKSKLVLFFGVNVVIICIWAYLDIWFSVTGSVTAWEYCNPLIIINSIIVFKIFKSLNIGKIKWINKAAQACFTVFLTHDMFLHKLKIPYHVEKNVIVMFFHMIVCAILIYFIGFFIDIIYKIVMKPIHGIIKKIKKELYL